MNTLFALVLMSVIAFGILLALVWLVLSMASGRGRRHEHVLVERIDERERVDEDER